MRRLKFKLAAVATSAVSLILPVTAHSEYPMHMQEGWMHTGGHMSGYGMWGMGWFGVVIQLGLAVLITLGIVYLYQQINENSETEEE